MLVIVGVALVVAFSSYKQVGINQNGQGGTNFISEFFPFGKTSKTTPGEEKPADVSGYTGDQNAGPNLNNKLRRVTNFTVAGYGIFNKERLLDSTTNTNINIDTATISTGNTKGEQTKTTTPKPQTEFVPTIRYVEKTLGNIYEAYADKLDEIKISSVIVPEIYESSFGNNANNVIMRYLKDDNKTIETFLGTLPKEIVGTTITESNEIASSFLPENITDLSVSSDGTKIFYLFNSGDYVVGINANIGGDKKSQVFTSPFTEWLSSYPNNKTITLTTKPSNNVPGYMYTINPDTKSFNKTMGGINGLTTLMSPDGKLVLYADGNLSLNIYNLNKKTSISVGARTLPEKCTWNNSSTTLYCAVPKYLNSNNYPDSWYMGENSFNDEIWKIDATTGNGALITDPAQLPGGEQTDGIKVSVDPSEKYLFFINKSNYSLWELVL